MRQPIAREDIVKAAFRILDEAGLEGIPLRRLGAPREIAHAICGLLDEDAGYITGQIIRADGGGSIAA